ncbi:MAG: ribosome-associated protein [Solirubrobacteraceae bacterium]|nr:ribosome-associated protein [Solirubrobacteraceae bacterium]
MVSAITWRDRWGRFESGTLRSDMAEPRDVPIREQSIRLGQLLKLAGLAGSGGEARSLVQEGAARVNGEVETRRGRQLRPGDVVSVDGEAVRVTKAEATP